MIPAFNESDTIRATIEEIIEILKNNNLLESYEILVVDDSSDDDTYKIIESFHNNQIKCIRLSRRSGSHVALRAGIANAIGDAVLCISADGQDDPSVLKEMLAKLHSGAHIVWALRKKRKEHFLYKLFAQVFYKIISWQIISTKSPIDLSRADFYLLNKKIVDAINKCPERNTSIFGLINWLGFSQDYVEFERRERHSGKSKWNFRSQMQLAKDWIVAFSGLPLRLMSIIGLFISSIGLLYAMFIFVYAMLGNPVQGWASTMVVILILGGIQMIMLGIIGEYLWRNLYESKKRPLYFIEKRTSDESNE